MAELPANLLVFPAAFPAAATTVTIHTQAGFKGLHDYTSLLLPQDILLPETRLL